MIGDVRVKVTLDVSDGATAATVQSQCGVYDPYIAVAQAIANALLHLPREFDVLKIIDAMRVIVDPNVGGER